MTLLNADAPLLYIVDDDPELCDSLCKYLTGHGFEVVTFLSADHALRRLQRRKPDLIVLDVMMPGTGGLTTLRRLRRHGDETPIILLTAKSDAEDRVIGLRLGADDYIGKPFSMMELLARIEAVLRRRPPAGPIRRAPEPSENIQFGPFVIDPRRRTLTRNGELVDIMISDLALLRCLASHPFKPLSRERLVELTGARITEKGIRVIDVQVLRLRRLIESDPAHPLILQTVRGIGYSFVPP